MDAGPLPAAAQQGGGRQGIVLIELALPRLAPEARDCCGQLWRDARVLAWGEGIHLRAEYLDARNAVLSQLMQSGEPMVLALETSFARSRLADAYVLGDGPDDPDDEVIRSVWSWSARPLAKNAAMLRFVRAHNSTRAPRDRVRIYGLEMYAGAGVDPNSLQHRADRQHARRLAALLTTHLTGGGDHRELAGRDGAQFVTLMEVFERHEGTRVLLFEQTGHLDRRVPGSLAAQLVAGGGVPVRTVGAFWSAEDPTVRFPLGDYELLSRWLDAHPERLLPVVEGGGLLDLAGAGTTGSPAVLREAASAFDAVLHVPRTTPIR
ncbi:erythromycin esterase family protein [Flexivirga caeni]|uniref:Erythromycin esterase family protein n=1 Tax=Flexivirga caeni TaxID=2294115 RepID=A0A3M9M302_9MICO|nr:erythromycin esterase family protein [Flexivirga caeni]RNI19896.1 hypothetical protein EFY87_15865 [Flexivirga caeni]